MPDPLGVIAWATVERHGGSLVKSTGDGILARFNAPSQALDFAVQFRDAVADLGLHVRCGIHTGEVEIRENGDITGTAVNLAARVQATADDDGLFVSSTVHDLLLGGGYHFDDRGPHELKGFEQPWRLYALTS